MSIVTARYGVPQRDCTEVDGLDRQGNKGMAKILVEHSELIVEVEGIDTLWALRCQLEIPLAHVRGAVLGNALTKDMLQQTGGTRVSGAVAAAGMLQRGDKVYWVVRDATKAVMIELTDERYGRLVVEVDDPATVVARINRAVVERRARGSDAER
jgi:hypothetical protein